MEHEARIRGIGASLDEEGVGAPVIVLEARDALVPIFVSADQAHSIQYALRGEPPERPLTHDLLVEMITEFGGAVDSVRIDDLQDGTFYAKVDAERYEGGKPERFVFDARPSDGIALALRVDCAIQVSASVLEEAGRPPEEFDVREFDDQEEPGA